MSDDAAARILVVDDEHSIVALDRVAIRLPVPPGEAP
jgi:hypothetical protein